MAISFLLCDGFTSNLNLYILDFNIYKKKDIITTDSDIKY